MNRFWSDAVKRSTPYVPGEQLNDPTIIKLNTNENPYPPSPKVKEAIYRALENKLNHYPTPTAENLREKIANFYHLNKENVFIGNGSDEVLAFSFMAFFLPEKKIRFPAISYSFYPVYCNLFHIPYQEVSLNKNFTLNQVDFFDSDGGVILPNPNAPTSILAELDVIKAIVENNPNRVVIIDEAYIDFAAASAVSLIDQYENLLVIQTMSKSRSLAGLRVGFAIGNPELIEALQRIKNSFNSYTIDRLALAGAEAAIEDTTYFKETTNSIIHTRNWMTAELKKRGFKVLPSATNFLFATHPSYAARSLYQQLKIEGILVRHFNKDEITQYLRISIGTDQMMEQFLEKLDTLIAEKRPLLSRHTSL
ncbi:MAG: histidinol-phosphate transaminase [Bacillota bacterium]|uniref:Histidinol-phosphate aminotransferase n=1 Tax=Virgibacillus salarius TaxID=447199 RepID=A0A941DZ71_9BACI|nr:MULTISPECIES: histidinol-phosphate transaminase [Bacillaceae]NAZ10483.1 histidinol-phosphate transaminase [Agaribacter marinus]MBR7797774.1 histidinol-phosphate transaminase [Virgibacillus salarius]MCC2252028.1 histidinol-phosphate transaminase [Virgibacillus sp. AGTR]MDY7046013.1 histidinol-phosphate transaminase [Virgibacillus sp. M23]QRZ19578.1 histidinol-phosphate transaminase [Virgibacillus sp. AGTR]